MLDSIMSWGHEEIKRIMSMVFTAFLGLLSPSPKD